MLDESVQIIQHMLDEGWDSTAGVLQHVFFNCKTLILWIIMLILKFILLLEEEDNYN